jgi:putative MFS transporter
MNEMFDPPRRKSGKTVQQYIDEIPVWADGTAVESLPMTGMQNASGAWQSPGSSSRGWSSS